MRTWPVRMPIVFDAVLGLVAEHLRDLPQPVAVDAAAVHEGAMDVVEGVLDAVEVVAGPDLRPGQAENAIALELTEAPHWWRIALSQIGEDEAEIFPDRIAAD